MTSGNAKDLNRNYLKMIKEKEAYNQNFVIYCVFYVSQVTLRISSLGKIIKSLRITKFIAIF